MVHYHGVFAPAARWRAHIVPGGIARKKRAEKQRQAGVAAGVNVYWLPRDRLLWRVFHRDIRSCPCCGHRVWLVDEVVDPATAQRELASMGMPVSVVSFAPSRGPPADLFPC